MQNPAPFSATNECVHGILEGVSSPDEFDQFVAQHGDELVRFAYLVCRDRGRAEDLTQEALFKAVRRWRRTGPVEHPTQYVRRIITMEYLGWRRRLPSREIVGLDNLSAAEAAGDESRIADRDELWRLLEHLPARQRAVLVLRYYLDYDDAQIAAMLGCAQGSVRSMASRALSRLRDSTPSPSTAARNS